MINPPEDSEQSKNKSNHPQLLQFIENITKVRSALAPGAEIQRRIQEKLEPLREATRKLQPLFDRINEFNQKMEPAMRALDELAKQYHPQIVAIVEGLRRFEEFNAGLVERHELETLALPPFFGEMTIDDIYRLFGDRQKPALDIYQEFFSKNENVESLLTSWKKSRFFEDRIPILRDALAAHVDGKHTLSIPAFLAQAEGALCEIFDVRTHGKVKAKLEGIKFDNTDKSESPFVTPELVARIIIEQVFPSTEKENAGKQYPNRQAVLHGKSLSYYKDRYASVRCILLLDFIRSEKFLALNKKNSP